ncbi:hypothetical protein [Streptomyces sp. NPDC059209]|uniref:hypothetical protein n=1 Tax=Streptomyces sp. NPDC059209 TaxID=3346769 RepID=UPI00369E6C45
MEPADIAAFVAAGASVVGVPTVLLVGRWQMRTGLRNAETAYRSALDTVKAQASETHQQWRRGVQRESYAAFLLAVNQLHDSSERFRLSTDRYLTEEDTSSRGATAALRSDMNRARTSLRSAMLVMKLEGPDAVANAAEHVAELVFLVARNGECSADSTRAYALIDRMTESREQHMSVPISNLARDLKEALDHLALIVEEGDDGNNMIQVIEASLSARKALRRLPKDFLTPSQGAALLSHMAQHPYQRDAVWEQFNSAREEFVNAARVELHVTPWDISV